MSDQNCKHRSFRGTIGVNRLRTVDEGPVTHYSADVKIECGECGQHFVFQGLPSGLSPYEPRASLEGTTLQAPIMPVGEEVPDGLPGFEVRAWVPHE